MMGNDGVSNDPPPPLSFHPSLPHTPTGPQEAQQQTADGGHMQHQYHNHQQQQQQQDHQMAVEEREGDDGDVFLEKLGRQAHDLLSCLGHIGAFGSESTLRLLLLLKRSHLVASQLVKGYTQESGLNPSAPPDKPCSEAFATRVAFAACDGLRLLCAVVRWLEWVERRATDPDDDYAMGDTEMVDGEQLWRKIREGVAAKKAVAHVDDVEAFCRPIFKRLRSGLYDEATAKAAHVPSLEAALIQSRGCEDAELDPPRLSRDTLSGLHAFAFPFGGPSYTDMDESIETYAGDEADCARDWAATGDWLDLTLTLPFPLQAGGAQVRSGIRTMCRELVRKGAAGGLRQTQGGEWGVYETGVLAYLCGDWEGMLHACDKLREREGEVGAGKKPYDVLWTRLRALRDETLEALLTRIRHKYGGALIGELPPSTMIYRQGSQHAAPPESLLIGGSDFALSNTWEVFHAEVTSFVAIQTHLHLMRFVQSLSGSEDAQFAQLQCRVINTEMRLFAEDRRVRELFKRSQAGGLSEVERKLGEELFNDDVVTFFAKRSMQEGGGAAARDGDLCGDEGSELSKCLYFLQQHYESGLPDIDPDTQERTRKLRARSLIRRIDQDTPFLVVSLLHEFDQDAKVEMMVAFYTRVGDLTGWTHPSHDNVPTTTYHEILDSVEQLVFDVREHLTLLVPLACELARSTFSHVTNALRGDRGAAPNPTQLAKRVQWVIYRLQSLCRIVESASRTGDPATDRSIPLLAILPLQPQIDPPQAPPTPSQASCFLLNGQLLIDDDAPLPPEPYLGPLLDAAQHDTDLAWYLVKTSMLTVVSHLSVLLASLDPLRAAKVTESGLLPIGGERPPAIDGSYRDRHYGDSRLSQQGERGAVKHLEALWMRRQTAALMSEGVFVRAVGERDGLEMQAGVEAAQGDPLAAQVNAVTVPTRPVRQWWAVQMYCSLMRRLANVQQGVAQYEMAFDLDTAKVGEGQGGQVVCVPYLPAGASFLQRNKVWRPQWSSVGYPSICPPSAQAQTQPQLPTLTTRAAVPPSITSLRQAYDDDLTLSLLALLDSSIPHNSFHFPLPSPALPSIPSLSTWAVYALIRTAMELGVKIARLEAAGVHAPGDLARFRPLLPSAIGRLDGPPTNGGVGGVERVRQGRQGLLRLIEHLKASVWAWAAMRGGGGDSDSDGSSSSVMLSDLRLPVAELTCLMGGGGLPRETGGRDSAMIA
ncbi:unnamed protein product [Vitrella brassicaformis CCMP3155]|uniref:Uncharacterized protein n=4 Tax=Vitrella brassicaformis TaxID=1169539 RepID=A0A0G4FRF8_VITBC|nr:unnamed protein product [Vitrella brassicaformis CCMP3155]|eukprot:CEM16652.1 unnamed protein product [Vitrella brassicaformis CCMP3155]